MFSPVCWGPVVWGRWGFSHEGSRTQPFAAGSSTPPRILAQLLREVTSPPFGQQHPLHNAETGSIKQMAQVLYCSTIWSPSKINARHEHISWEFNKTSEINHTVLFCFYVFFFLQCHRKTTHSRHKLSKNACPMRLTRMISPLWRTRKNHYPKFLWVSILRIVFFFFQSFKKCCMIWCCMYVNILCKGLWKYRYI